MKKSLGLLFLILQFPLIQGQSWTFKSGGDDFDGTYKTSSIVGKGSEFPYNKPLFVVNKFSDNVEPNVYLSDIGYTGCDDNQLIFVFDGERKYTISDLSTNREEDILFISKLYWHDDVIGYRTDVPVAFLLDEIKRSSRMSVRFKNDCSQKDFYFTLAGSSKAIDFVLGPNWVEKQMQDFIGNKKTLLIESINHINKIDSSTIPSNIILDSTTIKSIMTAVNFEIDGEIIRSWDDIQRISFEQIVSDFYNLRVYYYYKGDPNRISNTKSETHFQVIEQKLVPY